VQFRSEAYEVIIVDTSGRHSQVRTLDHAGAVGPALPIWRLLILHSSVCHWGDCMIMLFIV
jgi:hypothetical protein